MRTLILFFIMISIFVVFCFCSLKMQFYVPFEILIEMVFSSFAPPPK